MVALRQRGIPVPDSLYAPLTVLERETGERFGFPCIIKGSHGDRGNAVWLVKSAGELRKLIRETLIPSESSASKKSARKFMAQEFIPNDGDYRILVLGNRALGAMKRSAASTTPEEFRNNISCGGQGSVATDLPEEVMALAVAAAEQCHVAVAGVDIVLRNGDPTKPVVFEVNSGPQFAGFQAATGIDVPAEIVKFLAARAYEVRGITLAKAPDAAPTPACSFCHAPYAVARMRSSDGRVVGDACAHCRRRLLPTDTYRRPGEAEDVELDHRMSKAPVVGGRRRHHRSSSAAPAPAAAKPVEADASSACRVQ
jgi:RimK family alpha-L-glutamate ligase